jgi:hypothetical protein
MTVTKLKKEIEDQRSTIETLREFTNLAGLYTKVRPHIHLSLNKHGQPKLTQRTNIMKKNRTNYYRYNRIKHEGNTM